ncbi:hypothetical protein N7448_010490 [Penicillium atrosanguineum]|uniref:AB hydrolase-1 domain-containing protein n=1 Tax=Penicillium atrosanguineum TaxID=1132637 RepID=A0A9W9PM07_9EURO|nr:uncharacterized protein N7443_007714 [Penicillium atrosanguineum]KAJ5118784.1 hypothetical protein N7526_010421 [Penicillium atrosanguineum]KAJ5119821.1 hypothetical protein N7448_010490 [Penicillium atrosanguineum]KAJ5296821.1 hypothetical protein N7443_007714 [Penicillium atrosanguineum]KAJ5299581.1 hypothetical protein N7476_011138 [Penicillium atrosanguineum]
MGLCALMVSAVSAKTCYNMTIPITATAENANFGGVETPQSNMDVTAFILDASRQGGSGTEDFLTGSKNVSGRYEISARYCMPSTASGNAPTLQILTHGMGFDKSYWELPYNNYNYSYVDYALSRGYHTFAFDRLGIGMSSHGDAKEEIQLPLELESLVQLTKMLRNGAIHAGHGYGHSHQKPGKIVHVGHSFGSILTYGLSATYPDLSDAIVLTGYSMNSTFMPMFMAGANLQQARLNQSPGAFSNSGQNYTSGYLTNADMGNNHYMFLYPGNFDTKLLEYAEKNKQPLTVGELLTVSSVPPSSKFTGPVLIATGSNDVPFCGGDCLNTGGTHISIPAAAKPAFPSSRAFSVVIQPDTAHGLNLHYNATAGYKEIADFLHKNGLIKESEGVKVEISV